MEDKNDGIARASFMRIDEDIDFNLRPERTSDYVGQDKVKKKLSIFAEATKNRNEPLDHVPSYRLPGLGKTTPAHTIVNEMGVNLRVTSGSAIEKPSDLASILTNLRKDNVLFIDEIHRVNQSVEGILYLAMEDYTLNIIAGKGPSARSLRIDLEKFTPIGATTRSGQLTGPLCDRFGVLLNLELYDIESLKKIVTRSAGVLGIGTDEQEAMEIVRRSRGTPRITNRLLKGVRDYVEVRADDTITQEISDLGLNLLEVDKCGLDYVDRKIIMTMTNNLGGGLVGADIIVTATGEERITIEDVYEPYLLQIGSINRTSRRRIVTDKVYKYSNTTRKR